MTVDEWVTAFAREVGVDVPTAGEVDDILALAAVSARASERIAAPVTCWLAAQAGLSPAAALAAAERLAS
jgi:hypothetical protein